MSEVDKAAEKALASFDYIRFSFSDLNGTSRGEVLAARNAKKCFTSGISLWEGCLLLGPRTEIVTIPSVSKHLDGNMTVTPDLDTLLPAAWAGDGRYRVGEVLCNTASIKRHRPQGACPRYVAQKQLEKLAELGFDVMSGFEVEFVMVDKKTCVPVYTEASYMSHQTFSRFEGVLYDIEKYMSDSGIDVERVHVEYGPGMFEAVMAPKFGLASADMTFRMKSALLEIAEKRDLRISFMSKIDDKESGAGAHFNVSLWSKDTKTNAFYDASKPDKLSDAARHWVGGLLKHGRAICAFLCPSANDYRRLCGLMAPADLNWGIEDRHASIRVKNDNPGDCLVENRIPGARCNPYLVMAATLAAGIDGLINKIELPEPAQTKDTPHLPRSLEEALAELQADDAMVSTLGHELVEWFVHSKKEADLNQLKKLGDSIETEKKLYF